MPRCLLYAALLTTECVWLRQTTSAQAADQRAQQAPPSAAASGSKSSRSAKSGTAPEASHPRRAPLSAEERAAARQLELLQLMELLKDYDMFAPDPPPAKAASKTP